LKAIKTFFTRENHLKRKYFALPNAKDPRVIIPLVDKNVFVKGFEIHNTSSPLNKLIKKITIRLYFYLPYIQSKVLYPTPELIFLLDELKRWINRIEISELSVYVGTKNSRNQKLTLQLMDNQHHILGYVKLADNDVSAFYLKNEFDILNRIGKYGFSKTIHPHHQKLFRIHNHTILFLENIFNKSNSAEYRMNDIIYEASLEIAKKTKANDHLKMYYKKRKDEIQKLPLEKNLINAILKRIELIECNDVPTVLVHGDYVLYNMKIKNNQLALIDWEYAKETGFPLFDLLTFYYQGGYQIYNKKAESLIDGIIDSSNKNRYYIDKYLKQMNINAKMLTPLFVAYLAESLMLYLKQRTDADVENNHYTRGLKYLMNLGIEL
jgi:thiamine kinase-like enzyme